MRKINLNIAYDILGWDFIEKVLEGLDFLKNFMGWIWFVLKQSYILLSLSSEAHGYFHGGRGVRQEDPTSLPLFFGQCNTSLES